MKIVIAVALLAIVGALAAAGYFMLRSGTDEAGDPERHARMARALAWRVGLSVTLFLALLGAYALGWIAPTGLPLGR